MIAPGVVLDKYELQERVGQGGMAVVYRALDRSLKRVVAVKVLHKHLADSQEARDRFEREAHAVAKLRHENILEIFAFSGAESSDSYIVTEFIEGVTLKQFVTDHPLAYPEVGALIVLQIGRALAHAHAAGILHRDVKPENVMIRSDGVVKLTDFGISQMVDLGRLTVTGQLLGSPAYMAPEHVEGQPLDFRTDVFACGIVLYQLCVGRLPFEGKNPHEILKRIAECRFADPRKENPRIGNQLGKIILRALERRPDDRFQSIGELIAALERYVTGSGLSPGPAELARFFASPASYELALRTRLIDHLGRRGRELLATDRAAALQALDRVLTLDPTHEPTLRALAAVSRRQRLGKLALGGVGLALVGGLVIGGRALLAPSAARTPAVAALGSGALTVVDAALAVAPPRRDAGAAPAIDAAGSGAVVITAPSDAAPRREPDEDRGSGRPAIVVDAAPRQVIRVELAVSPTTSEVQVGDAPWTVWPGGRGAVVLDERTGDRVRVTVRNGDRFQPMTRTITAADASRKVMVELDYLPAQVVPRCAAAGVQVKVDGRMARLDVAKPIFFADTIQPTKQVRVEFVGERVDTQTVTVNAATTVEVTCAL